MPALGGLSKTASRSEGLALTWDRPETPAVITLSINSTASPKTVVYCTPQDDGNFTVPVEVLSVPVEVLSQLPEGCVTMSIQRLRVRFFPTPNGLAAVGLGVSGREVTAELQ